jgi:hypothetical protein
MSLDDPLDFVALVSGHHDEAGDVGSDAVVLAAWDLDLLETGCIRALAVEGEWRLDLMPRSPGFDPLVHLTEDLLVVSGALSKVHAVSFPLSRAPASGKRSSRGSSSWRAP